MFYTNAQSLYKKLPELTKILQGEEIQVVGVTETWVYGDMSDGELQINGFNVYRKDRKNKGWGVIMYVHESLISVPFMDATAQNYEESVWCVSHASKEVKLLVGTLYRSPNSSDENNDRLLVLLILDIKLT